MPRKEHLSTPIIIGRFLYSEQAPVPLETPAWFDFLAHHSTFYFDSPLGTFTARLQPRAAGFFWYAFRRYRKRLVKAYLGRSAVLTSAHGSRSPCSKKPRRACRVSDCHARPAALHTRSSSRATAPRLLALWDGAAHVYRQLPRPDGGADQHCADRTVLPAAAAEGYRGRAAGGRHPSASQRCADDRVSATIKAQGMRRCLWRYGAYQLT
jgi:hypothetical protein